MGLPTVAVPKYQLIVPSTGKELQYRPFLVKEEKILLIAMESDDETQMVSAIRDIISNCVYEDINVRDIPMFDIEYIFLQLRAKSKGEIVDLTFECSKCKQPISHQIDLSKVQITKKEGHNPKIPLSDDIGVIMRYPSMDIQKIIDATKTDVENIFTTISFCIESIWDKDTVYAAKDHTSEEMDAFLDSLPDNQFTKIQKFFDTIPVLKHDIELKCTSKNGKGKKASICGFQETKTLEGLASFFG
tara:strand:- start:208 stop:942 length:735 start_codon:yes stop_codon:yes gene_type:complete